MFKFLKNFKNRQKERKMADQYDQLLDSLPNAFKLNQMVYIRSKIVKFREKYGDSALTEDLYAKFDDRLKFVIHLSKRKGHGKTRNTR